MRFASCSALLLGLVTATFADQKVVEDFEPITAPSEGDSVGIGSKFTIKWDYGAAYYPGHMRISLVRGDSLDDLAMPITIVDSIATNELSYEWEVGKALGADNNYWIMVTYLKDQDIINYSSKFTLSGKSSGDNSTSTPSSSSPASTITSLETSTTVPSTTSIPTSTQPAAAGHATPGSLALLVAAIGMIAL